MNPLLRSVSLLIISLLAVPALAGDRMILEVTGVTERDIVAATGKTTLTLFDAYALAVRNAEELPMARENLRQAQARRHQAIGAILPRVSIRGSVVLFPDETNANSGSPRSSVSLYARQPIITGANEIVGFKGATHEIRMRRYELALDAGILLNEVAYGYYRIVQLEQSLQNSTQVRDLYRKTILELNRRVAVGRSRRSELLRTSEQLYRIEAQIRQNQTDLHEARLAFHALTGAPVDVTLPEGNDLADPAFAPDAVTSLIEKRWDIRAAQERIKIADAAMWGSIGEYLPSVFLEGSYRLWAKREQYGPEYYGALGFEVPLVAGAVPGRVEEMKSVKRQAELTLSAGRKNAEKEIRDAYQAWKSSSDETAFYRNALAASEENHRTIMEEYRLNLVTILDVITALESLQNTRNDYERVLLQHKIDRIRLGNAVNEFTGDGIAVLRDASRPAPDATTPQGEGETK